MKSITSTLSSQKVLDMKKKGRKQDPEPEEVNHCVVWEEMYIWTPPPPVPVAEL